MSQLRKIKRKDLNVEKYSKAIDKASNHRIYAESWYLDILTGEKWECWVYGDYEVIMPIPLQYKFGFKFVLQPIYCQQLGVFYREEIPDELFREFEKKLHKYRVRAYHFNEENTERYKPEGELKVNHVLDLDLPYEEIRKNYNRNRRRKLKTLPENFALTNTDKYEVFFELRSKHYPELDDEKKRIILTQVFNETHLRNKMILKTIQNAQKETLALVLYIVDGKRLVQLAAVRDKTIEDIGFFTLILDKVIQENTESDKMIDFGGSMIQGVAMYNESFGAEKNYYTRFSNFR